MTPEQHIDAIVLATLDELAEQIVADVRDRIDVSFPPASDPGESPHRRSGRLRDLVSSDVEQDGPSLTMLTVLSAAPYSIYLESGTAHMAARPFMGPARDDWAPIVHQRFTSAFSTSQPQLAGA